VTHPVAALLTDAASGRFPVADGGCRRVPPWRPGLEAVLAFTGSAVLAIADDVPDAVLERADGFGGAHHPQLVLDLAGPDGWIDSLDALLVLPPGGTRGEPLVTRPDLADHDRVRFAQAVRDDVRVYGRATGTDVATVSRGIGGLAEISVELAPDRRGRGLGAAFVRAAAAVVPSDRVVVAAVAPGNAASLRAFLAAGFRIVGSSQLLRPVRR
jgi:GNAT superfamily N-acetyltransferase